MQDTINLEDLFSGVYKNKRVLVLGHTGFKGSWLCLWLKLLGADITGISKYIPSQPSHFDAAGLHNKIHDFREDIRNYERIKEIFDECNPEIVFHLAAQPLVGESHHDPKTTFETNLGGTINILECIRQSTSVKSAVIITSDKCYENVGWTQGYTETDRLGGVDPYSASKACAEIAFSAYYRSFFDAEDMPNIATTRAGNVIGGGDWADDRIIPDCVRALSQGNAITIRKAEATRPWQHVLEPLSGYLWLGANLYNNEQSVNGESFNFGPKEDITQSVGELVDIFIQHWGEGVWKQITPEVEMKEATLLQLSCEKARELLDWQPVLDFEETVGFTAHWYGEYYASPGDHENLSINQIKNYIEKANSRGAAWISQKPAQILPAQTG